MTILLRILLVAVMAGCCADANARVTAHKDVVPEGYNFWIHQPDDSAARARPLIIFLHGSSLCGTNLDRVRNYGCLSALEAGRKVDAFLLAPQNPGGSWKPKRVMNTLQWVINHFNVDTTRISVVGMSLGGYGTIDFVAEYPDKVAAAMAICGGGTVSSFKQLNQVPMWIIHGLADRAVSVKESRKVVESMRQADASTPLLRYDEWPGIDHGQPARVLYMTELYQWLLSHSTADSPRQVNRDIEISPAKMKSAYKDLDSSKLRKHRGVVAKKKRRTTKK